MRDALIVATFTFLVALAAGRPLLRVLTGLRIGKQVRQEGPDTHYQKAGTPTMGGILIWGSVFVSKIGRASCRERV